MSSSEKGPVHAVATSEEGKSGGSESPVSEHDGAPSGKTKRPEREAGLKDFVRVFSYATKLDFVTYAVAAIASIGTGVTLPLMNVVFGRFTGSLSSFGSSTEGDFGGTINSLSLDLFILFLVRFALTSIKQFCFRMIGLRLSAAVRRDYVQCLFAQSIHVLDSMPPGAAATTITSTANVLQIGISEKLGIFLEWVATMIASLAIAFFWSWELTLVTLSIVVFLITVFSIILPFILKQVGLKNKADAKASAIASEALGSIRIVMACGAENRIVQRFAPHVKESMVHGRILAPLIALQLGLVFFALYAVFGLVQWYGVRAYLEGHISGITPVIICLLNSMFVVIAIERISSPLLAIGNAIVAACEFFIIIDSPRPSCGTLKHPDITATQDLVFKNVTFAYPSRPHVKVLDNLNLTIETGKITAIVGPSGSGKSTLVGLIERFYNLHEQYVISKAIKKKKTKKKSGDKEDDGTADDDDEKSPYDFDATNGDATPVKLQGSVTTCDRNLDEIDLKWWRSQIGLVQQEPFLFNESVYQNVAYGLIGSVWEYESDEKKLELVKEACREAFAEEFINRLPAGYQTIVGDSGTKLSGGQRQRLAIARSIVKKPKILILDEATSSIDVHSERIVQAALDKVSKNLTTITIAHRLSTIMKADRIVVIQKGRVVEQGDHESLLANEAGLYYGLVHAQELSLGDAQDGNDQLVDAPGDVEDEPPSHQLNLKMSLVKSHSPQATETRFATGDKKEKEKTRGFFRSFISLLIEQKSQTPYYVLITLFTALAGAGVPIMAYLFAKLVSVFGLQGEELDSQSKFYALMWLALAVGLGSAIFGMLIFACLNSAYIDAAYKLQYFEAMLFQKASYFDSEDNSHGTLTSRIAGDPKLLEELLGVNMAFALQAAFGIIGAVIISFYFSWNLALVAIAITMPVNIFATYYRMRYEIDFDKMNTAVFADSSKFASESIGASRTVASLTLEDTINTRYATLLNGHVLEAYKKARFRTPVFAISDSVNLACQALLFWYGGHLILNNGLNVFSYFVCYMAAIRAAENAGQGLSFAPNAAQVTAASNRIMDVRDSRNRDPISQKETVVDADGGIKLELRNVHFKYPTRDVNVIKGLNITVEKGQFAALVGASGCGKTTVISLLERFYEPNQGQILCNGKDISKINVYSWRKYLSLVAQEPTLLQGTVRENVVMGVDEDEASEEKIRQACKDASIDDFISSLPEGYDTSIGSRGVSLSGGQKQRIAIARALLRNPRVLLLDEATSSLDSESERLVQAALERAGKGRTVLVVAHRLATVQKADVIFVMSEGRVLEQGNHADLLRRRGVYWNMCQNQALDT